MLNRNNPFSHTDSLSKRIDYLSDADKAALVQMHYRRVLTGRIRRVARIAIVATRTNATSRQRRQIFYKRRVLARLRTLRHHQYRFAAAGFVLVISFGIAVTPFIQATTEKPIALDSRVKSLIGGSRDDAKDYLKYDADKKLYNFAVPQQDSASTYSHTGRNADAYSATIPTDHATGITVTANDTKIAITLISEFFTTSARKSDGDHLVYQAGNRQLIYTLKYNGLKEDIIIPKFSGTELSYDFRLQLPSGVEARLDKDGNIGIYSADPTLYGNISFSSDADRARVDKARENSQKTNLIMTIPYPVIKDSTGREFSDKADFELSNKKTSQKNEKNSNLPPGAPASLVTLNEYVLSLKAHDLNQLKYPISLDPTVQVANTADFSKLNLDNSADIDISNNLIKRPALTGGNVDSWSQQLNALPTTRTQHQLVVANGKMYILGGFNNVATYATVDYAPINNDGSVGSFISTSSFANARYGFAALAYNGYIYVIGGANGFKNDIQKATINSDGSLGVFTSIGTFPTGRMGHGAVAYNGYLYIFGGCTHNDAVFSKCDTLANDVQYTSIGGDGVLGSWSSTTLPAGLDYMAYDTYNGLLYISGGCSATAANNACSASSNSVYYSRFLSGGGISAWTQTTNLLTFPASHNMIAYKGYQYVIGGSGGNAAVYYAPIFSDGSLGVWSTTASITTGRLHTKAIAYNGYIIFAGGQDASAVELSDVQHSVLSPTGELGATPFSSDSDVYVNASYLSTTVAYNGYLYVMGGCTATDCGTVENKVRYAALNSDGSVGAFTTDSDLMGAPLFGHASFAYNGFLYVLGGCGNTVLGSCVTFSNTVYYSAIGANGNPGAWSSDGVGNFSGRWGLTAVAYNGFAYAIGGCTAGNCSTYQNDVQVAPINAAGDFGNFISAGNTFTTARYMHASAAYAGYLYVSGGSSGSLLSDTQYAPINSDGSIGAFITDAGGDYSTPRSNLNFIIDRGYAYVIGGCSALSGGHCSTFQSDVQYAVVNSDGSLGTWNSTQGFSSGRFGQGAVLSYGYLLVIGGCTAAGTGNSFLSCGTMDNHVLYQVINNGGHGGVGSWTAGTTFNTSRTDFDVAVVNGYVYAVAGCSAGQCTTMTNTVEKAIINADGTLGAWSLVTANLPTARRLHSVAGYNGYVYSIGGCTVADCSIGDNALYYAKPTSSGDITTWSTNPTTIPGNWREQASALTNNGYLYVIGGNAGTQTTDVYYAPLNGDGSVGSFSATSSYSIARGGQAAVINGGYVYVLAGCVDFTGCGSSPKRTSAVEFAKINADGTLGTFKKTAYVNNGSLSPTVAVDNGFIYIADGFGPDTPLAADYRIQYAEILSNGELGTWNYTTQLPDSRIGARAVVSNGKLNLLGGNAGSPDNVTRYTSLYSISRSAKFSKLYDFGTGVKPTKLITRGTKKAGSTTKVDYASSNNGSTTIDNQQVITDTGYAGPNALNINLGNNRTLSRFLFLRYTIDDSLSASFPDNSQSNITDFDLYFIANPGQRLRGGRTFINGADRGLNAQPQ